MKLKLKNIEEIRDIVDYAPNFDIKRLQDITIKDPKWLAFGSGNIFRAYIARLGQELVEKKEFDRGINVVETFDKDNIRKVYDEADNLSLSVCLQKTASMDTTLIGNICEALVYDENIKRVIDIFINKNLQIVSYIITEKGYDIFDNKGNIKKGILEDIKNNPLNSSNLMVISVGLLYERYKKGYPITLLSLDNLSKNGSVLKNSILTIAKKYVENGRFESEFLEYLNNEEKVSFPWTMIDKITPGPDNEVKKYLESLGFEDIGPYYREGNSAIAKFVNSEEAEYLAIEDNFTNGRPDFSKVGVYLVDRETVNKTEIMKVTACLNPLHTSLAIFGCLLSYERIYDEMNDPDLERLIKNLAYEEALPVVEDPGIIDPKDFVKEVIELRFPNPYIPDSPHRIATDTSLKIPVRFGKTLIKYKKQGKNLSELKYIPLVLAGWLRYLIGVDDNGKEFEISPDPNLSELKDKLEGISLGEFKLTESLKDLLRNEKFFGINLEKEGLDGKVIFYLKELLKGPNSVRKTLKKYTRSDYETDV